MAGDLIPNSIWSFPTLRFTSLLDDTSWARQSAIDTLQISEDNENVYVEAALPGVKQDDIDISFHQGVLRINGAINDEDRQGRKTHKRMTTSYTYQVAVPGEIDLNAEPDATYIDGLVCVTFPKQSAAQPKKISFKANGGNMNRRSKKGNDKTITSAGTPTVQDITSDDAVDAPEVPDEFKRTTPEIVQPIASDNRLNMPTQEDEETRNADDTVKNNDEHANGSATDATSMVSEEQTTGITGDNTGDVMTGVSPTIDVTQLNDDEKDAVVDEMITNPSAHLPGGDIGEQETTDMVQNTKRGRQQ